MEDKTKDSNLIIMKSPAEVKEKLEKQVGIIAIGGLVGAVAGLYLHKNMFTTAMVGAAVFWVFSIVVEKRRAESKKETATT